MDDPSPSSDLADNGDVRFAVGVMAGVGPTKRWLAGGFAAAFALAGLAHVTTGSKDVSIGLAVLAMFGGFGGAFQADKKAKRAAVEAEMKRLARYPFVIRGFFENLAVSPRSSCRVRMRLSFTDTSLPEASLVHDLLGLVDGRELERSESTLDVESGELDCSQNDGPDTNRAIYLWQLKVVSDVLEPIHEAHPLTSVQLSRA